MSERVVVFFDEGCLLCSGAVRFAHERDKGGLLYFAGLGSEYAASRRAKYGLPMPGEGAETFAVLDEGKGEIFFRSEAGLRLLRELGGLGRWGARLMGVMPKGLRDRAYDLVARNRSKWFGRTDVCGIPPGSLRGKVLD